MAMKPMSFLLRLLDCLYIFFLCLEVPERCAGHVDMDD